MTELLFLGTGAITPEMPGDHVAMLIRHNNANILLDAGPAIMMQLARAGIMPAQVTHIAFSHHHGDHILGSPMFMFYPRLRYLMAAPPTLDAWLELVELVYPRYLLKVAEQFAFLMLKEGVPEPVPDVGGVRMTIIRTEHVPEVPAYAMRFDFPQCSLVYSGDSTPSDAVVKLAAGADWLIHEATAAETLGQSSWGVHTTAREAGQIAARAGVKNLALVHRMPGPPQIWAQEAGESFVGRVLVPRAGEKIKC